ncbi:MAG: YibE/F family protein [Firmicutes bacterium]|nr:YibE/F family protein [Lachnospiraceae bacterium]MDD6066412.1 YibE/F family protein [Bacillota bacterium]MDY2819416.1 YibE/F family protein [Hominisplanchenecus sp.]
MKQFFAKQKNVLLPLIVAMILIGILIAVPTGYEDALIYQGTERAVGKVTATDNSAIKTSGLVQSGEQSCTLEIEDGIFKGRILEGVNFLSGSLEKDKIYKTGDRALLTISYDGDEVKSVVMSDHYRLDKEILLLMIFAVFLILFAGKNGFQAILSFVITVLMIWKVLVPCYLKGYSPVWVGIAIVTVITAIIIFFVYGPDKRTIAATSGSLLGILTTCILGICFTDLFQIHGAIMSNAESLLYSGYQDLDLTAIFMSSIFIGASGAMMDLAVDITSAIWEVIQKKPEIDWKEAMKSGIHVGQAAMGTMTTTLLLAYSGGYIALLMVFMAQGTPVDHILNYKYVAAEVLETVVGSFGLVTVAPFTAFTAGVLLTKRDKN